MPLSELLYSSKRPAMRYGVETAIQDPPPSAACESAIPLPNSELTAGSDEKSEPTCA